MKKLASLVLLCAVIMPMQGMDKETFHKRSCSKKGKGYSVTHQCEKTSCNRGAFYCEKDKGMSNVQLKESIDCLRDLCKGTCFYITVYSNKSLGTKPDRKKRDQKKEVQAVAAMPYKCRIAYAQKKKKLKNGKQKQLLHRAVKQRLEELGFRVETPISHATALGNGASMDDAAIEEKDSDTSSYSTDSDGSRPVGCRGNGIQ